MKKLSIFIISLFSICQVFAQQSTTIYNMQVVPQRRYLNPALGSTVRVHVGLPLISTNLINLSNSSFVYRDIMENVGDSLRLNFNKGLDAGKIKDQNFLATNINIDLLSFGFYVGKNYFAFNATNKTAFNIRYTRDFIDFFWNGNAGAIGRELDLDLYLNGQNYIEYGLTYAREINNKLRVGGRFKFLSGLGTFYTKKADLGLATDASTYALTARSDIEFYSSNSFNGDVNPTKILFSNNNGIGFDLGVDYDINKNFSVSASVIDIGRINWRDNLNNFLSKNPNASFTYRGLEIQSVFSQNIDFKKSFESSLDSLTDRLGLVNDTLKSFSTPLPTQFFVGGNYVLSEKFNVGALFNGRLIDGKLRPNFGLSANTDLTSWLAASVSYSTFNGSFSNLGAGLALTGPFQLYVVTDNILGWIMPDNQRNFHVQFGINLVPVKKAKDKDEDGVPDRKDMCPDQKGPAELGGCPDADGDKIIDKLDECPFESGSAELKGCPDRDRDGIADKDDKCPDAQGLKEMNGCPDTDGDGIVDSEDECPEEKGRTETKGCPDADNDMVLDKNDKCPDKQGLPENEGCPDTDLDGVYDNEDNCPTESGPKENKGCPWGDKDNDGVLDNIDLCPETPGLPDKNGCPIGDIDGDGVNDENDECPTEPGTVEEKGCPIRDTDGDGVPDKLDECPNEPGAVEEKGCPIRDTDGDGVQDKFDQCPKTPGPAENFGCPKIEEEDQAILNTAFSNLEFETGKDIIKEDSKDELDQLSDLLNKKTEWKLSLTGYTDNQGDKKKNIQLSQKRADAIKKYLTGKGIDASRITSVGKGPENPVADNKTPEGRAKNRRVEMKIIFE
jgi:outer membrane protein OmpA-like peptidoglycan-associated protein